MRGPGSLAFLQASALFAFFSAMFDELTLGEAMGWGSHPAELRVSRSTCGPREGEQ
jgi:hypothetical protein